MKNASEPPPKIISNLDEKPINLLPSMAIPRHLGQVASRLSE